MYSLCTLKYDFKLFNKLNSYEIHQFWRALLWFNVVVSYERLPTHKRLTFCSHLTCCRFNACIVQYFQKRADSCVHVLVCFALSSYMSKSRTTIRRLKTTIGEGCKGTDRTTIYTILTKRIKRALKVSRSVFRKHSDVRFKIFGIFPLELTYILDNNMPYR